MRFSWAGGPAGQGRSGAVRSMAFSLPRPLQHRLQQRREEDLEGGPKQAGPNENRFQIGVPRLFASKEKAAIDRSDECIVKENSIV